ncbi:RNA-binding protein 25, partial [Ophiophagus hannah]
MMTIESGVGFSQFGPVWANRILTLHPVQRTGGSKRPVGPTPYLPGINAGRLARPKMGRGVCGAPPRSRFGSPEAPGRLTRPKIGHGGAKKEREKGRDGRKGGREKKRERKRDRGKGERKRKKEREGRKKKKEKREGWREGRKKGKKGRKKEGGRGERKKDGGEKEREGRKEGKKKERGREGERKRKKKEREQRKKEKDRQTERGREGREKEREKKKEEGKGERNDVAQQSWQQSQTQLEPVPSLHMSRAAKRKEQLRTKGPCGSQATGGWKQFIHCSSVKVCLCISETLCRGEKKETKEGLQTLTLDAASEDALKQHSNPGLEGTSESIVKVSHMTIKPCPPSHAHRTGCQKNLNPTPA